MKKELRYNYSAKWGMYLFGAGLVILVFGGYYMSKTVIDKTVVSSSFLNSLFLQGFTAFGMITGGVLLCSTSFMRGQKDRKVIIIANKKGIEVFERGYWGEVAVREFVNWANIYEINVGRDYQSGPGGDTTYYPRRKDVLRKLVIKIAPKTLQQSHNSTSSSYIPFTRVNGERETMGGKRVTFYSHDSDHPYDEITINVVLNKRKKVICKELRDFVIDNKVKLHLHFKKSLSNKCVEKPSKYFL